MKRLIVLVILINGMVGLMAKKIIPAKWDKGQYFNIENVDISEYSYDSDAKIFYIFSNDSTYIYIHAQFVDETAKKQLVMGGFSLWVDPRAKGKTKMGVKYPIPSAEKPEQDRSSRDSGSRSSEGSDSRPSRESGSRPTTIKISPEMLAKFNTMELHNLSGTEEVVSVSSLEKCDVKCDITADANDNIHYNMKIPYEALGFTYESGKLISLTFEGNEIERPGGGDRSSSDGMGGRSSGGGMGGPPSGGGGMGGPPGGGMNGGMGGGPSSPESVTEIKVKVKHLQLQ